jgi:hypothetical protein
MTARENRWLIYTQRAARMGLDIEPDELWLLARIGENQGRISKSELERRSSIGDAQCAALLARLVATGMAMERPGDVFELSAKGQSDYQRLLQQREAELKRMLADWHPDKHPDVLAMMRELANSFARMPPERPRH